MVTSGQPLTVETDPEGVTIFRLPNMSDLVFLQWGQRLDRYLQDLQTMSGGGDPALPRRILHDLRALESPDFRTMSHLRAGLRMHGNRGLRVRCAVLVQNAMIAQLLRRLLGLPSREEADTLQIVSPSEVWFDDSTLGYFHDLDAALAWLTQREPSAIAASV